MRLSTDIRKNQSGTASKIEKNNETFVLTTGIRMQLRDDNDIR